MIQSDPETISRNRSPEPENSGWANRDPGTSHPWSKPNASLKFRIPTQIFFSVSRNQQSINGPDGMNERRFLFIVFFLFSCSISKIWSLFTKCRYMEPFVWFIYWLYTCTKLVRIQQTHCDRKCKVWKFYYILNYIKQICYKNNLRIKIYGPNVWFFLFLRIVINSKLLLCISFPILRESGK